MRLQPMIQVDDVEAARGWYERVLGLTGGHGGAEYEMLFHGPPFQTPLLLQLHRWDTSEHGTALGDPAGDRGNGVWLYFEVDDRDALAAVWARAGEAGTQVIEGPHYNQAAHHHEIVIRDLDGYVVVVATPFEG